MTPEQLAALIRQMPAEDLVELNRLLADDPGWGASGVREPRRPAPVAPGDSVALDPDYWETAE